MTYIIILTLKHQKILKEEWEKDLKKKIKAREQIKQSVKDILALDINKLESTSLNNEDFE